MTPQGTTRQGTLITVDGAPALRFERRYRHPIERVWRAVTDPDEMAQWFPSEVRGDRAVGAELAFVDDAHRAAARAAGEPTRADGPMFRGTVLAYDPPRLFAFSWGGEVLRIELHPDAGGTGTVLVFTHLLSHVAVAARNGAGWHVCLGQLDRLLGAEAPDEDDMAVYQDYVTRVGPPLGVPSANGNMTWERATHVDPARVRKATTDASELAAWGADARADDPVRWDLARTPRGTVIRVTHDAIDGDAELAATWHALLVQLDMYLAAGQILPVDHAQWVAAYEAVL